jgi:hypothetical protein
MRVLVLALSVLTATAMSHADEDDEPMPASAAPTTTTTPPLATAPSETPPPAADTTIEKAAPAPSRSVWTGAGRLGLYTDSDQTNVYRALAAMSGSFAHWNLAANVAVDVVSSSSVDVRSSPGLSKVDVTTSASGRTSTSGGNMSDRRIAGSLSSGWHDASGHALTFTGAYANERDYNSVNGGVNGAFDVWQRLTTLMFGFGYTHNWIASVLDPTFAQQMYELAYSAGAAQVLTRLDALRLRYDGAAAIGYQASPYRNVRFGDWQTSTGTNQRITFLGTLGSADGLPETEPDQRIRHAGVLEWVHSFSDALSLYVQARLGIDTWGVESAAGSAELRAASRAWRFRLGYRFYAQSQADFYRPKYLMASNTYAYYTSDKELSQLTGHVANIGVSRVLKQPHYAGDTRVLLDVAADVLYYDYPDFVLLKSRTSGFVELGLTWEP